MRSATMQPLFTIIICLTLYGVLIVLHVPLLRSLLDGLPTGLTEGGGS